LLVGAGLLAKSFLKLMQVDPGFKADQVLTMQLSLPSSNYKEEFQLINFYRGLFSRLETIPSVQSAGMVNDLPMSGVNINGEFLIEGDRKGYSNFRVVSPGYFNAMGIPLIKGRTFTDQDRENSTAVAVISQSVAAASWPNEDPIGKRIKSGMDNRYETWNTIIGVVGDVKHAGLAGKNAADLYVNYTQHPSRAHDMTIVVKSNGDPTSLVSSVRTQVNAMDSSLPVTFQPMHQVLSNSVATRRYNAMLLGSFALVALVLSVMGIYGVMSYAVSHGTREIGIRMALGAQSGQVLKLIVSQGLTITVIGIGLGVIGALGLTRLMSTLLYGVTTTDAPTFLVVSGLLTLVALVACYIPARRATAIDPMVALRCE
jgi:putative ABC transport system permease protein